MIKKDMLQNYLEGKEKQWESLCVRCGGCCGFFDDPCKHLKKNQQKGLYCEIYPYRFGERETLNGEEFDCVSIKEVIHTHWKNDHVCVYKQHLKSLRARV